MSKPDKKIKEIDVAIAAPLIPIELSINHIFCIGTKIKLRTIFRPVAAIVLSNINLDLPVIEINLKAIAEAPLDTKKNQ